MTTTSAIRKSKQAKPTTKTERDSLWLLAQTHGDIFALSELANAAPKLGWESAAIDHSVVALVDATLDTFKDAVQLLPTKHPAKGFIRNAETALRHASELAQCAGDQQPKERAVTFSRALLGFVRDAGRWMERAELALDSKAILCGWLDADDYVEGMAGLRGRSYYRHAESRHIANIAEALSGDARLRLWFDAVERIRAEDSETARRLLKAMDDVVFVVK